MTPDAALAVEPSLAPARLAVADAIARDAGAAALLVAGAPAVRWLGLTRPAGALVLVSGGAGVVVAPDGAPLPPMTEPLEAYEHREPGSLAGALERAFSHAGLGAQEAVAVEAAAVPLAATRALDGRRWLDASPAVAAARMRKDADELALIESAARFSDLGHRALRAAARDAATELELWTAVRSAIETGKGRPLHAIVDLMAGERTEQIGLPPSGASMAVGAPILFDFAPRHDGYWADSCTTFALGEPGARLRRMHEAARAALDVGAAALRPGVRADHVDARVRARLEAAGLSCPHHVGHGVGAAPQEEPWLRPGSTTVIEEGMVVAMEPGAYGDGVGARLEHLFVVESDGARPLTSHSLSLT